MVRSGSTARSVRGPGIPANQLLLLPDLIVKSTSLEGGRWRRRESLAAQVNGLIRVSRGCASVARKIAGCWDRFRGHSDDVKAEVGCTALVSVEVDLETGDVARL